MRKSYFLLFLGYYFPLLFKYFTIYTSNVLWWIFCSAPFLNCRHAPSIRKLDADRLRGHPMPRRRSGPHGWGAHSLGSGRLADKGKNLIRRGN